MKHVAGTTVRERIGSLQSLYREKREYYARLRLHVGPAWDYVGLYKYLA